jgi:hypothetical protein
MVRADAVAQTRRQALVLASPMMQQGNEQAIENQGIEVKLKR